MRTKKKEKEKEKKSHNCLLLLERFCKISQQSNLPKIIAIRRWGLKELETSSSALILIENVWSIIILIIYINLRFTRELCGDTQVKKIK